MFDKLIDKIKGLMAPVDSTPVHETKRKYITRFRVTWDIVREHRRDAGMLVSGETRRALRAHIKRRLSKVKV